MYLICRNMHRMIAKGIGMTMAEIEKQIDDEVAAEFKRELAQTYLDEVDDESIIESLLEEFSIL